MLQISTPGLRKNVMKSRSKKRTKQRKNTRTNELTNGMTKRKNERESERENKRTKRTNHTNNEQTNERANEESPQPGFPLEERTNDDRQTFLARTTNDLSFRRQCIGHFRHAVISTKVVPQQHKSARNNADW